MLDQRLASHCDDSAQVFSCSPPSKCGPLVPIACSNYSSRFNTSVDSCQCRDLVHPPSRWVLGRCCACKRKEVFSALHPLALLVEDETLRASVNADRDRAYFDNAGFQLIFALLLRLLELRHLVYSLGAIGLTTSTLSQRKSAALP